MAEGNGGHCSVGKEWSEELRCAATVSPAVLMFKVRRAHARIFHAHLPTQRRVKLAGGKAQQNRRPDRL